MVPTGEASWGQDINMIDNDAMMGIRKADMEELKELKVKLPVKQLLRLHLLKMTSSRTFSELVSDALGDYFTRQQQANAAGAAGPPTMTPAEAARLARQPPSALRPSGGAESSSMHG